jgi:hypothetical protein
MLASAHDMFSERRGLGQRIRIAILCAALVPTLSACAPAVGGAVLVSVVTIGALTSHCYDYLDVTVFDEHGRKTCAATVTAKNGGDHFELSSCYYAPLTDGVWTLTASLPGRADATTSVPVEHANDCTRHVQSVELSISAPGAAAPAAAAFAPPPAPLALPPPPAPPPATVLPAPASAPAAAPPNAAPVPTPAGSVTPPVGVFPAQ